MEQLMNWLCSMPEWMAWLIVFGIGYLIFVFGFYLGIITEMGKRP